MRIIAWILLFVLLSECAFSQLEISNGVTLPATDTLRVFIVFAEIDFSDGKCPENLPDNINGSWPKNADGKTLVPDDADSYFDFELKPGQKPKAYITDYYFQSSFGSYVLLGDYYPKVLTFPCSKIKIGDDGLSLVIEALNKEPETDSTLFSFHELPLKSFDSWSISPQGVTKLKKSDGSIDLLYIIWRNNRFIGSKNTKDNSGYGVSQTKGSAFKNMKGVNNRSSFNSGSSGFHGRFITIAEHLHAIFGGNQWHTAGGRGLHTFMFTPHSYGLTGQYFATMQAPCAWDRWMMNWKNPDKKMLISATDTSGKEINTETISINDNPDGGLFVLRDFMTYGDAIRIKLPHINWEKSGDVKNQYLWLENRRMNTNLDQWYTEECADNNNGAYPNGTPGMYAYIQVGKDLKSGGNEIYSTNPPEANALASFLFPFSAEGNFDFFYCWNNIQDGDYGLCGNWGNENIPVNKKKSAPNPFTGFSDLYDYVDSNNDGLLYSGDDVQPGLSDQIGDSIYHNYNQSGDWQDAFCKATSNTMLSISTNPAPVPVYTLSANYETKSIYLKKGAPESYENRTIWLNGLSVEILKENIFGHGEILLKIRWNNYDVSNDVRWCGNIVLSPNDFDLGKPSLILKKGKKITIDRGLSPQISKPIEKDASGRWIYTDTTTFTALDGAYIKMEQNAKIEIDNLSKFILKKGSKFEMGKKSKLIIYGNSSFIIEEGAVIVKNKKSRIIFKK